ncbi:ROK family protein [Oceanobacillus jeddahense]|uniref:ROK family protein n=1 Tax=Oceanobacillus jeddahense TaxID=1462527 RepID=A0ABY5JSQ8_9BACI|nr:ROK family protein [Oceanobacillus jeddahense]UUI02487.1 ROK family protein [Oceanobacillus jeddahense]
MKGTGVLREKNKREILSIIRHVKKTTRQDLVTQMNVSKNTVSLIVDELISNNFIKEAGIKTPREKGRPKQIIELDRDGYRSIGIAIEKDYIEYVVINYYGEIIEKETYHFNCQDPIKTKGEINSLLNRLKRKYDHILGVGIAIPGIVNNEEKIVYKSVRLGWENFSIGELDDQNIPVFIQNNVNMSALSAVEKEEDFQTGGSFYYVHISNGVGGAYITNKQVMNGVSWTAGEIGHISVDPQGELCICGQKGCLEQLISIPSFKRVLTKEGYLPTSVNAILDSEEDYLHSQKVKEIIHEFGEYLGRALVPVIHLLNPNQIIIDNPYAAFNEFEKGCMSYIQQNALEIPFKKTKVTFGRSSYRKSHGAGLCAIINYERFV